MRTASAIALMGLPVVALGAERQNIVGIVRPAAREGLYVVHLQLLARAALGTGVAVDLAAGLLLFAEEALAIFEQNRFHAVSDEAR